MATTKIAITVDEETVKQIDRLVREGKYKSRSNAIQSALKDRLGDWRRKRFALEAAKLDPREERELAEESLNAADECEEY
ncbi:MAG: ribbon-helix-helix protein, CopG family [Nitrospinae bacterium]|nr:ribbon-helix-helix protein, CopG family [Nitrospinota bacterium]